MVPRRVVQVVLGSVLLLSSCGTGGSAGAVDGSDVPGAEAAVEIADVPTDADAPDAVVLPPDPGAWGPHEVGTTVLELFDEARQRKVRTVVWYPAKAVDGPPVKYLLFVTGRAHTDAPADLSGAPYPLVLFSHGFNGVAEQSVTFTEHLASQGYVVAAMNHEGNLLGDAGADDDEVAVVALERPYDVAYAHGQVLERSAEAGGLLSGLIDPTRVAVSGHSFGGYTALVAAGGQVAVDDAVAACDAGSPSDIFCPYVAYWPAGAVEKLEPPIPGLEAVIALCPGGASAFGEHGLDGVAVPSLLFGGTLDTTTPVDVEIDPIFAMLGAPKYEAVIDGAAHLSFTNVCDIPIAARGLKDFCGVEGMRQAADTFPSVNALATAFLNVHVKGDAAYRAWLSADVVAQRLGAVGWKAE